MQISSKYRSALLLSDLGIPDAAALFADQREANNNCTENTFLEGVNVTHKVKAYSYWNFSELQKSLTNKCDPRLVIQSDTDLILFSCSTKIYYGSYYMYD
jgi:hypothetical protein